MLRPLNDQYVLLSNGSYHISTLSDAIRQAEDKENILTLPKPGCYAIPSLLYQFHGQKSRLLAALTLGGYYGGGLAAHDLMLALAESRYESKLYYWEVPPNSDGSTTLFLVQCSVYGNLRYTDSTIEGGYYGKWTPTTGDLVFTVI